MKIGSNYNQSYSVHMEATCKCRLGCTNGNDRLQRKERKSVYNRAEYYGGLRETSGTIISRNSIHGDPLNV